MAMIDPEMQSRLTAAVLSFSVSCERLRKAAMLARLDAIELAATMDVDLTASLEEATVDVIQKARGIPTNSGDR